MDEQFGLGTGEWRAVDLWDGLMRLVPRATNILLVGKPLCDNEEYLDGMVGFTADVARNLVLLPLVPKVLKPVLGPMAAMPGHYHYRKTARHSVPLVRRRLADMERKERGDPALEDWEAPDDYVTWHIATAKAEGRRDELSTASTAPCARACASARSRRQLVGRKVGGPGRRHEPGDRRALRARHHPVVPALGRAPRRGAARARRGPVRCLPLLAGPGRSTRLGPRARRVPRRR